MSIPPVTGGGMIVPDLVRSLRKILERELLTERQLDEMGPGRTRPYRGPRTVMLPMLYFTAWGASRVSGFGCPPRAGREPGGLRSLRRVVASEGTGLSAGPPDVTGPGRKGTMSRDDDVRAVWRVTF
jgi:hypothetical protein